MLKIVICLAALVCSALADCDNDIEIKGLDGSYGNDITNGFYTKWIDNGCHSRDVFNHTERNLWLHHIDGGSITGYWIVRNVYNCGNNNKDDGYIRVNDGADNPGLVSLGWKENEGGNWQLDNSIDVDCYSTNINCDYQISGAANTTLNGLYVEMGENFECEFRNAYEHETNKGKFLYMQWSTKSSPQEYFWFVSTVRCKDAYSDALLRNDDYSVTPNTIFDDWEEQQTDGLYAINANIHLECIGGAGQLIGNTLGALVVAVLVLLH